MNYLILIAVLCVSTCTAKVNYLDGVDKESLKNIEEQLGKRLLEEVMQIIPIPIEIPGLGPFPDPLPYNFTIDTPVFIITVPGLGNVSVQITIADLVLHGLTSAEYSANIDLSNLDLSLVLATTTSLTGTYSLYLEAAGLEIIKGDGPFYFNTTKGTLTAGGRIILDGVKDIIQVDNLRLEPQYESFDIDMTNLAVFGQIIQWGQISDGIKALWDLIWSVVNSIILTPVENTINDVLKEFIISDVIGAIIGTSTPRITTIPPRRITTPSSAVQIGANTLPVFVLLAMLFKSVFNR